MGNIESVDGQSEMKHHIMPLKVPMPDPMELEERFALVLVSHSNVTKLTQRLVLTALHLGVMVVRLCLCKQFHFYGNTTLT